MLPVGTPMPSAVLRDQYGAEVVLGEVDDDIDGPDTVAGPLVVVFFPAAFTSVCTSELRALRDSGLARQIPYDESVVAISCDSFLTLRAFADAEKIDFPLLSDFWPHGAVSMAYDAFDAESGTSTRTTYVVDVDGVIRWGRESGLRDARDFTEARSALLELIN